jgi:hypothetical protein
LGFGLGYGDMTLDSKKQFGWNWFSERAEAILLSLYFTGIGFSLMESGKRGYR